MLKVELHPNTLTADTTTDVAIRLTNTSDHRIRGVAAELEIHGGVVIAAGDPVVKLPGLGPSESFEQPIRLLARRAGINAVVVSHLEFGDQSGARRRPDREPLMVKVCPPTAGVEAPQAALPADPPLPSVFISHRRDETPLFSERFAIGMSARLRRSHVFLDVWNIQPGDDFMEVIENELASASALVALIGPQWERMAGPDGRRRIMEPHDVVRYEIATALRRHVRVLPVIFGRSQGPRPTDLPPDLATLSRFHWARLSERTFDADLRSITGRLMSAGLR
ncbi:toll/interleukin-1 receptor domain-containing protein [Actinomycetes bacterium KLBMP 9759]